MGAQRSGSGESGGPRSADAARAGEAIAERIEQTLLGGPRRYTRCEAAEAAGVSMERAREVWRALGFADTDDDARVFTDGDIEALRTWTMLADATGLSAGERLPQVRALGQSLSRLADWQVKDIIARVSELGDPAWDETERAAAAAGLAEVLLPVVEGLQSYAWRRHLVAAIGRYLTVPAGELSESTMVVGFADIVGFTSTARHTGSRELSALLEAFEQDASEAV